MNGNPVDTGDLRKYRVNVLMDAYASIEEFRLELCRAFRIIRSVTSGNSQVSALKCVEWGHLTVCRYQAN